MSVSLVGCGDTAGDDGAGGGGGGGAVGTGCERPVGYPATAGYVGAPGAEGCGADAACIIFPGRDLGKCYGAEEREAPCTILGAAAPDELHGFSPRCDLNDVTRAVCNVPAGDWIGTCGSLDEPATLSGVLPACETQPDARDDLPFATGPTEVVRFSLLWSTDEPASVNVRSVLRDAPTGEAYTLSGNDLEIEGSFAPDAPKESFLALGMSGDKLWEVSRFGGCAEVRYEGVLTHLIPALQHRSMGEAMPLAKGTPITSHWSCSETLGSEVGSFLQYYRIRVGAGETLDLSLTKSDFAPGIPATDGLAAKLYTAEGEPVIQSGNQAGVDLGTEVSVSQAIDLEPGEYLIEIAGGGCPLTRYTLVY